MSVTVLAQHDDFSAELDEEGSAHLILGHPGAMRTAGPDGNPVALPRLRLKARAYGFVKTSPWAPGRVIVCLARDPFALSPWPAAVPVHLTQASASSQKPPEPLQRHVCALAPSLSFFARFS